MPPALVSLYGVIEPIAVGTTITAVVITALSGAIGHVRFKTSI